MNFKRMVIVNLLYLELNNISRVHFQKFKVLNSNIICRCIIKQIQIISMMIIVIKNRIHLIIILA